LFRLTPCPAAPALVAVPNVLVATPDAYRWWDEMHPVPAPRGPVVFDHDAFASWGSVGRLGGNDFEVPVFSRHPELRSVFERLAQTGPLWVRLCGSGAAVAAVYRSARDRDDAAAAVGGKNVTTITTDTRAVAAPAASADA
jgi:4-diphosphocytidyl-2-C-methyl-D-erythritol kinase